MDATKSIDGIVTGADGSISTTAAAAFIAEATFATATVPTATSAAFPTA